MVWQNLMICLAFDDTFSHFDIIPVCDGQIDRQTHLSAA